MVTPGVVQSILAEVEKVAPADGGGGSSDGPVEIGGGGSSIFEIPVRL